MDKGSAQGCRGEVGSPSAVGKTLQISDGREVMVDVTVRALLLLLLLLLRAATTVAAAGAAAAFVLFGSYVVRRRQTPAIAADMMTDNTPFPSQQPQAPFPSGTS